MQWARNRRRAGAVAAAVLMGMLAVAGCQSDDSGGTPLNVQYQRALKLPNAEARGTTLVRLAYKQEKAGDSMGAETSLTAATKAGEEVEDAAAQAKLLNLVAYAYGTMGRSSTAKRLTRSIRRALGKIDVPETRALHTAKLALIYGLFLDNVDSAKSYLAECEQLVPQIKLPEVQIDVLGRVASNYHQLKLDDEATRVMQQARQQAEAIEDPRQKSDALINLAARLHKMEQADDANEVFEMAESVAGAIEDPLKRGYAFVNLAAKQQSVGKHSSAADSLKKAQAAADEVKDLSMRNPLNERIGRQRGG